MAATWTYTAPGIIDGFRIFLRIWNGGDIQLTVSGVVANNDPANPPMAKAKIHLFTEAVNDAGTTPLGDNGGGAFSGLVTRAPNPAPMSGFPVPDNQLYKVVVWPGEAPMGGGAPIWGAPVVRQFAITNMN